MTEYIAYLHQGEGSTIGVSFPDFPGCVTSGETLQEAMKMAGEALEFHIEGMREEGIDVPTPSALDQLAGDGAREGAVVALVSIVVEDPPAKANITLKRSQLERIDQAASAAGLTRSAFMVRAALGQSHAAIAQGGS